MATTVQRRVSHIGVLALLVVGVLTSVRVPAQEQQQIVPIQFSFSDPGARSMGFGGAFVALADDATAAFANPAGLVQLLRPEVSIEGRNWRYSTPFTTGGRVEGLPSGFGIDTAVGLRTGVSRYQVSGPSFLSLAFPQGNWSLAFFRHEYSNIHFFGETQGLFGGGTECCQIRFIDQRASSDLDIVNYGFSAAYRISDRLSLGLGLVYYDVAVVTNVTQFLADDDSQESLFALNSYLPARSLLNQRTISNDTDLSFTAGLLWRLSESWRIGGVYRRGPEIGGGQAEVTAGEAVDFGVPPGGVLFREYGGRAKLPDVYGLGLAYRDLGGRLTVSFQWNRVEYSDIPASLSVRDQTVDDVDELHLGAEYVFLTATPIIAVRIGAWLEPDHQMRATTDDSYLRALLPRGKDEMHYAAGLGLAMQRLQVDLSVDIGERVDTASLSVIYSF